MGNVMDLFFHSGKPYQPAEPIRNQLFDDVDLGVQCQRK